ncbi:MAG: hypothetical protein Q8S13_14535 [Dehalococcoidia bacterium]|nr:hypothetical protein [Dehalococcoidia bacterium]
MALSVKVTFKIQDRALLDFLDRHAAGMRRDVDVKASRSMAARELLTHAMHEAAGRSPDRSEGYMLGVREGFLAAYGAEQAERLRLYAAASAGADAAVTEYIRDDDDEAAAEA